MRPHPYVASIARDLLGWSEVCIACGEPEARGNHDQFAYPVTPPEMWAFPALDIEATL